MQYRHKRTGEVVEIRGVAMNIVDQAMVIYNPKDKPEDMRVCSRQEFEDAFEGAHAVAPACPKQCQLREHGCSHDVSQCWEPFGELGHDERHVALAPVNEHGPLAELIAEIVREHGGRGPMTESMAYRRLLLGISRAGSVPPLLSLADINEAVTSILRRSQNLSPEGRLVVGEMRKLIADLPDAMPIFCDRNDDPRSPYIPVHWEFKDTIESLPAHDARVTCDAEGRQMLLVHTNY